MIRGKEYKDIIVDDFPETFEINEAQRKLIRKCIDQGSFLYLSKPESKPMKKYKLKDKMFSLHACEYTENETAFITVKKDNHTAGLTISPAKNPEYFTELPDRCGFKLAKSFTTISCFHDGDLSNPEDQCGWCGSSESLTEPRDYGYPDIADKDMVALYQKVLEKLEEAKLEIEKTIEEVRKEIKQRLS